MLATSKMKKLDFGPLRPFVTSREALRVVFFFILSTDEPQSLGKRHLILFRGRNGHGDSNLGSQYLFSP